MALVNPDNEEMQTLRAVMGEEFDFDGGDHSAVLLIHGMMGGPLQLRELGQRLASEGFYARGPLLPGHCTTYEALSKTTAQEWQMAVESEYLKLTRRFKRVYVAGFSLGGLLTLNLARKHRLAGMALLGVPIYITRSYLPVEQTVEKLHTWFNSIVTLRIRWKLPHRDGRDVEIRMPMEPVIPLSLIRQVAQLSREVRERVGEAQTERALIVHSRADVAASPESSDYLMKHLPCENKEQFWLRWSHHEMMFTPHKDKVLGAVADFFNKI